MTTQHNDMPPTTDTPFPADPAAPAAKPAQGRDDVVDLVRAMFFAALIALSIRTFLFEPFNIPSGSMFPTLLVGDYLFVEKYSYGYSKYSFPLDLGPFDGRIMEDMPERGDVAVFRQPKRPHIDYIKRIIGLPGDKIQMKSGLLYINGQPVTREYVGTEDMSEGNAINVYQKYIETLPDDAAADHKRQHYIYELSDDEANDNTQVYTVPEGMYFAMGDNRDASLDSRIQDQVGYVPAENLVGRAAFIFFSTAGIDGKCEPGEGMLAGLRHIGCLMIEWPQAIRYDRFFKRVQHI